MKEKELSKKWRWLASSLLSVILLMTLCLPVYADNNGNGNGNGNGNPPPDPGVGSGQDNTISDGVFWVLPHGDTFIINGQLINIVEDWDSLEWTSEFHPGNSNVVFIGIGGNVDYGDGSYQLCGNGNGLGNCINNGNGNGGNGNGGGGGPHMSADCGGVWVVPGIISATANQIAPNLSVIVGQDEAENGVTLDYHISITPTVINHERWRIVAHRHLGCNEDDPVLGNGNYNNGNNNDNNGNGQQNEYGCADNNCGCPNGWHPIIQHIWGCTADQDILREGIGDLIAGATLQLDSRAWILSELANAYPGARLKNPDWGYRTTPVCTWAGDVCNFDFTLTIPVEDPGWYDIKVEGVTAGTQITPSRGFDILAGEFGTYFIDTSTVQY